MRRRTLLFWTTILLGTLLRLFIHYISPPALYSDEADQGYNAYSLLITGKDEHGVFLPVSLRSFGDWKPPLQTYLAIPFISILGLTEYAVRLPSVILGVLSIVLTYYTIRILITQEKIALIATLFLSISPWHLQQSRSAMLVMVAYFFFVMGVLFMVKKRDSILYCVIAALAFGLSIYAYYGMRVIIPMSLFLLFIYRKGDFSKQKRQIRLFLILFIFSLLPLLVAFLHNSDVVFGRAKTISVFYDKGIKLRIEKFYYKEGVGKTILFRFFHNKVYLYFLDMARRFFSHLDPGFLIINGDKAPPFLIPNMGVIYKTDFIFLLIGIFLLLRENKRLGFFMVSLLAISIIPASMTFMTPSANRTFNAVFPIMVFVSIGLFSIIKMLKHINLRLFVIIIFMFTYIWQFYGYLKNYYKVLPHQYAQQWLYGYKNMVKAVQQRQEGYDNVIILPKSNISYIYFLFYGEEDKLKLAKTIKRDYKPDEFGFEHVSKMGPYIYLRRGSYKESKTHFTGRNLFVGTKEEMKSATKLYEIFNPDRSTAFVLGK